MSEISILINLEEVRVFLHASISDKVVTELFKVEGTAWTECGIKGSCGWKEVELLEAESWLWPDACTEYDVEYDCGGGEMEFSYLLIVL